jgi:hypothetical protein
VCIELNKKTIGNKIGKRLGICRNAIFAKIVNSISLLELLRINSIKSIEINKRQEKIKTRRKENKFSFNKYLITNLFFNIDKFF